MNENVNKERFIVLPNNLVWDNHLGVVVCRCILEGIGDAEYVCQRLNEQQSIITKLKELNDDKGKRIISLIRINKTLKKENEQLRGINKEIGDDLYNCRLNKDIVSEKLKLWQDTLAEYDIYTIKDFKELMKNDN